MTSNQPDSSIPLLRTTSAPREFKKQQPPQRLFQRSVTQTPSNTQSPPPHSQPIVPSQIPSQEPVTLIIPQQVPRREFKKDPTIHYSEKKASPDPTPKEDGQLTEEKRAFKKPSPFTITKQNSSSSLISPQSMPARTFKKAEPSDISDSPTSPISSPVEKKPTPFPQGPARRPGLAKSQTEITRSREFIREGTNKTTGRPESVIINPESLSRTPREFKRSETGANQASPFSSPVPSPISSPPTSPNSSSFPSHTGTIGRTFKRQETEKKIRESVFLFNPSNMAQREFKKENLNEGNSVGVGGGITTAREFKRFANPDSRRSILMDPQSIQAREFKRSLPPSNNRTREFKRSETGVSGGGSGNSSTQRENIVESVSGRSTSPSPSPSPVSPRPKTGREESPGPNSPRKFSIFFVI